MWRLATFSDRALLWGSALLGVPVFFSLILLLPVPGTDRVERRLSLMGTTLAVSVEAVDRETALAASERAVRALEAAEARLSTWRDDTELARLNRAPVGKPVLLSSKLAAELTTVRHWWQETGGAFDPGVGALVDAWGLRHGGRLPGDAERRAALAVGGLAALDLANGTAVRCHPGLRIEEGGFGKGAGLDAAVAALAGRGVFRAVLDLGGQVAVFGDGPFAVGIADPRHRDRPVLRLEIDHGSVATSGNSERGIVIGGVAYGHILDPRRGEPVRDFGSLTVWASDALTADCLSTGLYVLGPDAALAWASARPGVEVVVVEMTADGLHTRATAGLEGRLMTLDQALTLDYWRPGTSALRRLGR